MSTTQPYITGNNHEYLCNSMSTILNNISKLTSHYTTLLTYYHVKDKSFYNDQCKVLERYYLYLERTEENYKEWKNKDTGTLNKYEKELVQQIEKQLANTEEIGTAIKTHINSLDKTTVQRPKYLKISDVLSILDGVHQEYKFVRNTISNIEMQGSNYFIHNRITFVDKKFQSYYVDYITNTPVEDSVGRDILNKEVADGIYVTMKYKIEKN